MKILTILGSPRKHGNTAAILGQFEALLAPAHLIERVNVIDYDVRGCLGCDACQKAPDRPACRQKDEAPALLERIVQADLVVYAAPVYLWSFPAQLKALLDRHYCLTKWSEDGEVVRSLLEGKRVALLVTCGGSEEENADLIQAQFAREMAAGRCETVAVRVVADCTTPAELGERGRAAAAALARDAVAGRPG